MLEAAKLQKIKQEPHIWSSVIRSLRAPLKENDIDADQLMAEVGISKHDVDLTNGEIPLKGWMNFMEKAAVNAGNPLLGVDLARTAGPETLGAVGFLFLSSPTIHEAFLNMCHYMNLLQGVTNAHLVIDDYETAWVYQIMHVDELKCIQDVEFSLTLTKRMIKIFAEDKIDVLSVNFRHSPQMDRREYEKRIKVPVHFNQEVNSVVIPTQHLNMTGKILDSSLAPILKAYLDEEQASFNKIKTLSDQVRYVLYGQRIPLPITAKKVARHVGLSEASLYRKLKSEGVRFSDLLEERNFGLAKEYLSTSDMTVTQVAHIIGFADSSSFCRAFTRWSGGITPSEFPKSENSGL
ncbi:AraC family transcriptional regulator [Kordiimonas lipolytica]|uniref:AraC family transcriptional regulator n=1 Tax=Kordiimonas lipolytica TaxID=1662421 RepID=A0ABV8U8T2_9PROT|nr:AraC family transcriptional regulator [Kordiimonas lipolytica]